MYVRILVSVIYHTEQILECASYTELRLRFYIIFVTHPVPFFMEVIINLANLST
jgi:hypothetical protein